MTTLVSTKTETLRLQLLTQMEELPVLRYRQENLRRLVRTHPGGMRGFTEFLGYAKGSFMSQMLSRNATRKVTEKSARDIERKLQLPALALDVPSPAPTWNDTQAMQQAQPVVPPRPIKQALPVATGIPAQLRTIFEQPYFQGVEQKVAQSTSTNENDEAKSLNKIIQAVFGAFTSQRVAMTSEKFAGVVELVFIDTKEQGHEVRDDQVRRIVKLLK